MILGRMLTVGGVMGAAYFGGSAYVSRAGGLSGLADTKVGALSFWCRMPAGGALRALGVDQDGSGSLFVGTFDDTKKLSVFGRDTAEETAIDLNSVAAIPGGSWAHVCASWDMSNTSRRHIYINGASSLTVIVFNNVELDIGGRTFAIARAYGSGNYTGALAEVWFDDTYIDFSQSSNRLKFRTAGGKPADVGANGATPTGSQPLVYVPGYDEFVAGDNLGSGGDFTVTSAGNIRNVVGPW